jgi:hypothetical protein
VSLFLCTFDNCKNGTIPNDVIVLRNNGEDQEVFGERLGGEEDRASVQAKQEANNILNSSPSGSPGAVHTKIIA